MNDLKPQDLLTEKGLVTLSNDLIRACYKLSVSELRLLLIAMAQMPKGNANSIHIDPKQMYFVRKSDFLALGSNASHVARDIQKACDLLTCQKLVIETDNIKSTINWTSKVFYFSPNLKNRDKVDFEHELRIHQLGHIVADLRQDTDIVAGVVFTPEIIPFISRLTERFVQTQLALVGTFESFYSFRIYLMMAQFAMTNNKHIVIRLDDFKYALELGKSYNLTHNLKARVLDVAINEINEKTSLAAQYWISDSSSVVGNRGTGYKADYLHIEFREKTHDEIRDPDAVVSIDNALLQSANNDGAGFLGLLYNYQVLTQHQSN